MAKKRVGLKLGFEGQSRQVEVEIEEEEPRPWDLDTKLQVAGTRVPRAEGPDKVTGRAKYTADVNLPGMLHARILGSPHAAAEVTVVDVSKAAAIPGVRAIVSCADRDWPTGRTIRYAGQEVAAVAADTEEIATDALAALQVSYQVRPCVVTCEDAMKPGAPAVNRRGNVMRARGMRQGDVDGGFARSAATVTGVYRTQVQTHSCMESHGSVARWETDGGLTVWCSTQSTFGVRDMLARHFGLEPRQVTVLSHHVGGGFGSKFGARPCDRLACVLAKKTGKPVKLMLDRALEHLVGGNRPSSIQTLKVGATKDGDITSVKVETTGAAGAAGNARCAVPIIYRYQAVEKEESSVLIHAGPSCAMRAPGHPQGVFAFEVALDELADKLSLDPLEFRKKNDPDPIRAAQYALGAEKAEWKKRRNPKPGGGAGPLHRGLGLASTRWGNIGYPGAEVDVRIHKDGGVEVFNGAQDIGTGMRTAMAVIVSEELGVPVASIRAHIGDTRWPWGPASGGSATLSSVAPAARVAAVKARDELLAAVAAKLSVKSADCSLAGGKVLVAGREPIPWAQACSAIPGDSLTAKGKRRANLDTFQHSVAGVQFAEVEVDLRTGQVRVLKVVAIQDCGRVVNRLTAESQITGGVIQGLGYALYEERVLDKKTGGMLNADFENYRIPGALEIPEIDVVAFDVANGGNVVGAAGLGEPPVIPTAAAVANAIANASGVRVRELPMTPDRVLAAIEAAKKQGGG